MGKRKKGSNDQDLSSFMSVLIMTIGCLTILLVANTVIIASNPDNLQITSVFVAEDDDPASSNVYFKNKEKEPTYLDVYSDYLVMYPGGHVVPASDLERSGNAMSERLDYVKVNKEKQYFVLLLRPGSAIFGRRLRGMIMAGGVDIGEELYEMDRKVNYHEKDSIPGPEEAEPAEGEAAAEEEAPGPDAETPAEPAAEEAPAADGAPDAEAPAGNEELSDG